ncbi:MAG: RHS repeat-associated core domain-containing protein [Nannocystaceae bacterium]
MGPECHDRASPDRLRWVGDPVDVVTGALAEVAGEFSIPGAPPIVWQRHASTARAHLPMPLGWGQTHEYDQTLRMVVDGWLYAGPSGDEVLFVYGPEDAEIECAGFRLIPRSGGVLELATPRGERITFDVPDFGRISRPRRIREAGGVLLLEHDRDGRLVRIRDEGDSRVVTIDHSHDRITALWLTAHPQRRAGAPLALMRYRYDGRGDLVEAVDRYGHRQAFTYDEHHRLVARTDRSGYRFEYEYDAEGRCVVTRGHDGIQEHRLRYMPEAQATLVTRGDGGEWLYRYDDVGSITEIIDPRGGVRRFEYDPVGNLVRETDPTGNARSAVLGPTGEVLAWKTSSGGIRPPDLSTGPRPHRVPATSLELDLGDLATRVLQGAPKASAGMAPPFLHGASIYSRLFDERDPAVEGRCRRDELGLLVDEHATGAQSPRRWSYTPNGWVRRYVDHDGGEYHFQYTSWNHRCAATDPVGRTIRYEYTSAEKIAAVVDPAGNRHEYRYDLQGNLAEVHHSGALLETYENDLAGNLLAKRDARGKVVVRYEYGPDNLKSRRVLSSGEEHRYTYTPDGRFSKIDFGPRSLSFTYDPGGKRTRDLLDGRGVTHRVEGERLVETTLLGRFTTRYINRSDGAIELHDPTGRRHVLLVHDDGRVTRELACGLTEEQRYNSLGRCLQKRLYNTNDGAPRWRRDFHYSAENDLVAEVDSERGLTTYRHDAAHQLAEVVTPDGHAETYRYDEAANLLTAPHLRRVAVGLGNKLLTANGDDFTYDHRNNLVAWESGARTLRFHHDALDQLVRIDGLEHPWTAEYDPLGRRIRKTYGAEVTEYLWDTDRLAAELLPGGRLRVYVYLDDFAFTPWLVLDYDDVDADPASGRLHTLVSDQRGAPVLALDADGNGVWSATLAPYGFAETEGDLDVRHRLAGQLLDPETGLHYNRFRYYSPVLGRYLEEDPAGLGGGLNLRAYTDNPIHHEGPSNGCWLERRQGVGELCWLFRVSSGKPPLIVRPQPDIVRGRRGERRSHPGIVRGSGIRAPCT